MEFKRNIKCYHKTENTGLKVRDQADYRKILQICTLPVVKQRKKKQIKSVASNLLKLVLSNTVQQIFIYLKEKLPHPVHIINLILINLLSVCVK